MRRPIFMMIIKVSLHLVGSITSSKESDWNYYCSRLRGTAMAAVQTTIAGPNTQADVPIDALLTLLCMECKDGMYLWAEVDRVKTQLHELQATMKSTRLEQTRIGDYVLSFVTHAQLDAAMTTRVRDIYQQ